MDGPLSASRRCPWVGSTTEYVRYHDEEWGRPVTDDRAIFEMVSLEAFQSGLSWLTILRKRDGFREAFADFDPVTVAAFGPDDVARLLADAGIVRHRAKIEATIANARAMVTLWESGASLATLLWAHATPPGSPPPAGGGAIPPATAASKAVSKDLRRAGFVFVGPTTAYAAMQAVGVVNDHIAGCFARSECEAARAALA